MFFLSNLTRTILPGVIRNGFNVSAQVYSLFLVLLSCVENDPWERWKGSARLISRLLLFQKQINYIEF